VKPFRTTLVVAVAAIASSWGAAAFAADPAAHWTYKGGNGPGHWGDLDEKFEACRLGKNQSPIDIRDKDAVKAELPAIEFDYHASPLKIVDNGHTIQVNYAPGSGITVGGKRYELVQFHFHKPSEEHLNGKAYPMVAHLVHRAGDGTLAVVGVLLKQGARQAALAKVFDNLPAKAGEEVTVANTEIDLNALLPKSRAYYTFAGSLTTPPCSEGVTWFVLKEPSNISAAQLAKFGSRYAMNARPVQPLNGRTVQVSQ
jgi:carbonic anhydrase